jgi:hypothetical protein
MYYSRVRARIGREELRVSLEHVNELLFFNPARAVNVNVHANVRTFIIKPEHMMHDTFTRNNTMYSIHAARCCARRKTRVGARKVSVKKTSVPVRRDKGDASRAEKMRE